MMTENLIKNLARVDIETARNLDELTSRLNYHNKEGINFKEIGVDLTSLPTFGGDDPEDTEDIWSWDDTRLMVTGDSVDLFQIVDRKQYL